MTNTINRRQFVTAVGALAVGASAAGCTRGARSDHTARAADDTDDPDENNPDDRRTVTDDWPLTIDDMSLFTKHGDSAYVDVAISNVSDSEIGYVEAEALLYNAAGERVGDGMSNALDVRAGETLRFEIPTLTEMGVVDRFEVHTSLRW